MLQPRIFLSLITLSLLTAGCNPMTQLYKQIRKFGFIELKTPLAHSGSGTIIGGAPNSLNLMAPPQECFPDTLDGVATNLRTTDATSLPSKSKSFSVNADVAINILKLAETSSGTIEIGAGFNTVSKVELEMDDAYIEYMNAPQLTRFYLEKMDSVCKQYLDIGGFIYQALKVGKLKYTFYNKTGGKIHLTLDKIKELVDIGLDLSFVVEENAKLVFNTPRYLGYQLGRLKSEDNGISLFRSNKVKSNKWVWTPLNIFENHSLLPVGLRSRKNAAIGIDQHSLYR